jgi:hypothetical protein
VIVMSNLLKIIAAFAAGVVVALGGALLYVHASEMIHPPPAVQVSANDQLAQTPAPPPEPAQPALDQTSTAPAPAAEEKTVKKPAKKHTAAAVPSRESIPEVRVSRTAPARNVPIQIAQNTPPQNPPAVVAPTSNDNGQFSLPQPPPPSASEQPQSNLAPAPVAAPARQPHTVTLAAGTAVTVRLGETLSTDHNYTGDTFRATLDAPIIMDGFIIADHGSRVLGRIVNAQKAGHFEGTADLVLSLTEINTTDGQRVTIQTNTNERKANANSGQNGAKIAGGAALGAIIGAIAGGGKGAAIGAGAGGAAGTGVAMASHTKACVIPVETQLSFRLAAPVTLTEKLN